MAAAALGRRELTAALRHCSSPRPCAGRPRTFAHSARTSEQQQQQRVKSEALSRTRSKIPIAKAKAAQASRAQLRPPSTADRTPLPAASPSQQPHPQQHPAALTSHHTRGSQQHPPAAAAATALPKQAQAHADHHADLPEVIAYSTAQAYDFAALARSGRLPPGWSFLEEGDVIHIPTWPPHEHQPSSSAADPAPSAPFAPLPGETFIFRSGAYVSWGLTEDQARRFHRAVIRGRAGVVSSVASSLTSGRSSDSNAARRGAAADQGVEVGAYDQIGDEAMEYLIRDDQPTRVVGDLIVLGHKPRLASSPDAAAEDASALVVSDAERERSPGAATSSQQQSAQASTGAGSGDSSAYAPWSPLLARLSFSLGLARSARLTTQESSLDMFMLNPSSASGSGATSPSASTSRFPSSAGAGSSAGGRASQHQHPAAARIPLSDIPRELERTGRVPLGRKEVIKRMGKLLRLRLEANLDVEESFLDENAFWENERLQNHYESICRALDIDRRFKAFNEKLDHVESLLSTLRALLTESSSHRMELIIIILIAIEVLNAFFGHQHREQIVQLSSSSTSPSSASGATAADEEDTDAGPGGAGFQRGSAVQARPAFQIPSIGGLFRWISSRFSSPSPAAAA